MDAIELRRRGVELLSPVLVPYGFVYQAGEVDRGSGGLYAHGGFARANCSVRRAGLPRSPLAITLLGWAWAHLRTQPARNAAP